jgi:hypothetical protein
LLAERTRPAEIGSPCDIAVRVGAAGRIMGGMAQRMLYEDGRPYTVPDSLEELTGPTSGVVELPLRLDWSEQGTYHLSDPRQRNLMYEVVIREAMRVEDLRTYLHGPTLRKVWRRLWLPRKVRTLWESRFPTLPTLRSSRRWGKVSGPTSTGTRALPITPVDPETRIVLMVLPPDRTRPAATYAGDAGLRSSRHRVAR